MIQQPLNGTDQTYWKEMVEGILNGAVREELPPPPLSWEEITTYGRARMQDVCAEQGLNLDQLTDEKVEELVVQLTHESREREKNALSRV